MTCHHLQVLQYHAGSNEVSYPKVFAKVLFDLHAEIMHVVIEWYRQVALLLFSDFAQVGKVPASNFQATEALDTHRQHLALGLKVGQSPSFELNGQRLKVVLVMMSTRLPNKVPQTSNRLWRHQTLILRSLSFCPGNLPIPAVLRRWKHYPIMTSDGRSQFAVHDIRLLGDTRSADDFGVFCNLPNERLHVGCGLRPSNRWERFTPTTGSSWLMRAPEMLGFIVIMDSSRHMFDKPREVYRTLVQQLRGRTLSRHCYGVVVSHFDGQK